MSVLNKRDFNLTGTIKEITMVTKDATLLIVGGQIMDDQLDEHTVIPMQIEYSKQQRQKE